MMKNRNAVLLFSALFLAACGGSSSGDGEKQTEEPENAGPTVLEGVWNKPCGIVDPQDDEPHYDVVTVTFEGLSYYSDIENYQDAGCQIPLEVAPNPTSEGTFRVGENAISTSGRDVTELDMHLTRFDGAPFDVREFTIFRIEEDKAYFGADHDDGGGTTAATRVMTLDVERVFFRQ